MTEHVQAAASYGAHDWIDTGPQQVAPGVVRIPLALPLDDLRAVNVYALVDGDGLVLIDSGWQGERTTTQLRTELRRVGFALSDVREILVTHVHRDHYSEAMTIRRLGRARIGLGAGERPNLAALLAPTADDNGFGYFQHVRSHGGDELIAVASREGFDSSGFAAGPWEPPDVWLEDATTVELVDRELRVIATPGHTRGHVVFLDLAQNILFAGDHVLPHITPSIGLEPASAVLPLGAYLSSLDLMLHLPDTVLLPAHGHPSPSVHDRVREILDHHRDRLDQFEGVVRGRSPAAVTAYAAACEVPWTSRLRPFGDLATFQQMLAVSEAAAHLDVLETRGAVSKTLSGQCWQYRAMAPGLAATTPG